MKIDIRIPQAFPQLTVKEVLEDYFLIPRKIRHFLRTKKHVRVNGELINWQSPITAGDLLELTFDHKIILKKYSSRTGGLGGGTLSR